MAELSTYRKHVRRAMATEFSLLLRGDDSEHLDAVASAALEEIERVERLLSRFDPAAEVTRVNRSAVGEPIHIPWELVEVLTACRAWRQATEGYFEIGFEAGFELAPQSNVLVKRTASAGLDFGGFGKGYALDCARQVLEQFGVEHALLCGGGSSWLALGTQADDEPWSVVVEPAGDAPEERFPVGGGDALSISETSHAGEVSDVVDPTSGRPIEHEARCMVVAATAAAAEVWSTALLAMGQARGFALIDQPGDHYPFEVYWSE